MCNQLRSGDSWTSFLAKYRLKNICDISGGWSVESCSGSTYTVRCITRLDECGSMFFTYQCNCPARKRCRHIEAVEQMRYAEEMSIAQDGDTDGMDLIERTH